MDDMQNQMNAILNDPQMMQKIMAMAQSLNSPQSQPESQPAPPPDPPPDFPDIDLSMLQKLSGFIGQSNVDTNQRSLLKALSPYLSKERISKLERAMRAAKMANVASSFLNSSGSLFRLGR